MSINRTSFLRGLGFLIVGAVIGTSSGCIFAAMHEPEPIYAGPGVTKRGMLGDYFPALARGPAEPTRKKSLVMSLQFS